MKTATTRDELSGGRAYLGIGAGWFEPEARGLGVPLPSTRERLERLEETLNSPQVLSYPHPPIMIGGMGEKETPRLVARYADACNLFAYAGSDTIRHKLDVLRGHCEDLGRDYEEIQRTALSTVNVAPDGMNADGVIGLCRELNDAGIQHAILNMPNVHELSPLETFGEKIIPAVAEL